MKKTWIILLFGLVIGNAVFLSLSCTTSTSAPNFQDPVQTIAEVNPTYTFTEIPTCTPTRTPTVTPTGTLSPAPTATATITGTVQPTLTPVCL